MIEFEEIILGTREDAEKVLEELRKLQIRSGFATVSDYLNLVGLAPNFSDTKVGWTDLSKVHAYPLGGGFSLNMPEPTLVENRDEPKDAIGTREELLSRLKKSYDALEGMISGVMMQAVANDIDPYQMLRTDGNPVLAPLVALQASTAMTIAGLGGSLD